jgi:HAD superfamily hydrolase (TIGR01509 family)
MIKGVLFDMDGVLVDSEHLMCKAAIQLFREKGYTVYPEDFKPFSGMGENKYLGGVAAKYGVQIDLIKDKERAYTIFGELAHGNLSALPGAVNFIRKCRGRGLKLAIATSADKIKLEINLRETGLDKEFFDSIVTGMDVKNKKPFPDIYLKAAINLQLEPFECLVVEDAVSGITSAKAAGCRCLAVETTFGREALSEADWICKSLTDVPEKALDW